MRAPEPRAAAARAEAGWESVNIETLTPADEDEGEELGGEGAPEDEDALKEGA